MRSSGSDVIDISMDASVVESATDDSLKSESQSRFVEPSKQLSSIPENINVSPEDPTLMMNTWECVYCGESYKTEFELAKHISVCHNDIDDFSEEFVVCYHCDELFSNDSALHDHTNIVHFRVDVKTASDALKKNSCGLCDRKFATIDAWLLHMWTHTYSDVFKCMVCRAHFTDKAEFLKHTKEHIPKGTHKCASCYKTFAYAISRDRHLSEEHLNEAKNRKRLLKRKSKSVDDHEKKETVDADHDSTSSKSSKSSRQSSKSQLKLPKTVRCDTCGFMFESEERMLKHAEKHLQAKQFVCEICGSAYKEEKSFEAHKLVHTGQTPFKCDQCDKAFRSRALLAGHKRKHKPAKRNYVCSKCGKACRSLSTLTIHETVHDDVKPCHCEVCGRGFSTEGNLKRHMSLHTGLLRFSCEFCHKQFREKRSMYAHMEDHVAQKQYACKSCNKKFAYEWNRKEHEQYHEYMIAYRRRHGKEAPAGKPANKGATDPGGDCEICGKRLPTGFGLYRHSIMHKREPLTCRHCGLTFTLKLHYDNHQAVHTGGTFSCNHCSREFVTQQRMLIHEREVHTGEKPYQCSVCPDAFTTRVKLKAHERVHKGTAISCTYCSKVFISKGARDKHLRIHDKGGESSFSCTVCTKSFRDEFTLSKHMRTHKNSFECSCGKIFTDSISVQNCSTTHVIVQSAPPTHDVEQAHAVNAIQSNLVHHEVLTPITHYDDRGMELQLGNLTDLRIPYHVTNDNVHGNLFVCGLCQQGFFNAESLMEHSKLHLY